MKIPGSKEGVFLKGGNYYTNGKGGNSPRLSYVTKTRKLHENISIRCSQTPPKWGKKGAILTDVPRKR